MELKKTSNADLEKERITFFLMSIVLVLSVLFVVFEWKWNGIFNFDLPVETESFVEEEYESDMDYYIPDEGMPMLYSEEKPEKTLFVEEDFLVTTNPVEELKNQLDSLGVQIPTNEELHTELSENKKTEANEFVYTKVDNMPEFPGGISELIRYIYQSIKYPEEAIRLRIQGRVVASFIINVDGSISDVKIERGVDFRLNDETLRVLQTLPHWKPGTLQNKPVRVKYFLPIDYRL